MDTPSARSSSLLRIASGVLDFAMNSAYTHRQNDPAICDFVFGNPHEMPLQGFVDGLQQQIVPHNKDWFAYKMSEPSSQETVAESLRQWRGVPFEPQDIHMTTGAFAALAVTLDTLLDPGDEVIFISPPWFFYELLITKAGGVPVRVKVNPATFDLDLEAIEAAISPRTKAIIVNSPNNPTGRIYPESTLEGLGNLLTRASQKNSRPIYLMSDESYSRIVFDGQTFLSPTRYYAHSLLIYTYGKTLLTPGQRIGFIALPPDFPDRETMRPALLVGQIAAGWAFPNALLQHALSDLNHLSIDIAHLQRKRDRMGEALSDMGYQVHVPEGTFYMMPRAPWDDDLAYLDLLAEYDVFCLPGTVVEMPGYFRISLTASDDMIDRALPGFAAAIERARSS